ncbi:MAG TPA: methionyl-tRNA formyltransferase [Blastocatellia bacterium]|nr:methionyl-tRNA formyltransferase [Blastocatellia bacterium]
MGTPEFAVAPLARLIGDGHQIAAVFTQPDKPAGRGKQMHTPPVKTFALEHGIPVHQPAKIKSNEEVRAVFEQAAPDACIVAAYGKILPAWLLEIPRLGCLNVHASLLPKYRGAAPINWAIANGERETGVTIMQMDAGMDTGAMLAKQTIQIGETESAPELSARLSQLGAELLSDNVNRIERGEIKPEIQDDSEATYAPMLKREDGLIDWRRSAREISNRVRAFQPWPGAYTFLRGVRLTIWSAKEVIPESVDSEIRGEPGTIARIDSTGVLLRCVEATVLRVEEMQLEGKRRLSARDVANGLRLAVGDSVTDAKLEG